MRRLTAVLAIALTLVACSGGDDDSATSTTATARSDATLRIELEHHFVGNDGSDIGRSNAGPCYAGGPFSRGVGTLAFMKDGADVLLKDGKGSILAKTTLANGAVSDLKTTPAPITFTCRWQLTFADADAADFYQLEVDGHVVATVAADEIVNGAATVDITP